MTIKVGEQLPEAVLRYKDDDGPHEVTVSGKTGGRRVVIFGLPGPFTATCTAAHLPSFIRTADAFREKGIDEIICFAVADVFVMEAWGKATGADKAGITLLADPASEFTKALGLAFDAPVVGFHDRTVRHAMVVNDGVVEVLQIEEARGTCEMTAGETLLGML